MIYFLMAIMIIFVVFLCIDLYELTHFELNEYVIDAGDKINEEFEFLVLSDLHNNSYGKNNCKLLKCINDTNVRNIVIAGDMVTGKEKCAWKKTEEFIIELAKNHKIFYINGNHEYRTKIYVEKYGDKFKNYKNKLESAGVEFLENESVDIGDIRITGVEIDRKYYKKFKRCKMDVNEIVDCIGEVGEGFYNILVAHNPRYMNEYKKWNPDMIISGHFHGGVMRVSKNRGVISPQFDLFPKYSGGIYELEKIVAIVSRGLGTHSIKVRIFNRPEVIKIKLQKQ